MASVIIKDDIILSPRLLSAAGLQVRIVRKNTRTSTGSGYVSVNVDWVNSRREYDFAFIPMSLEFVNHIETIFEVTDAGAYGFLLRDPKDSTVSAGEGILTSITSTTYQLGRRWVLSGTSEQRDRKITRPIESGLVVYKDAVPEAVTVNTETGVVTFASAPGAAALTWTGAFHVPVQFQSDILPWQLERGGQESTRLFSGQGIVLQEVRE